MLDVWSPNSQLVAGASGDASLLCKRLMLRLCKPNHLANVKEQT